MEPAKQELTPQRSGDEQALEKAVKSPLIVKSSVEEIKQVLRLVMIKVGLRSQNWPKDEEKAVLIDHIVSNYGGHTVEEIKLAFDMAMAGKLDAEDVKCYENFSCIYFSMIMNSYRNWAASAYKVLKTEIPPIQRIFSQEELDDSAREDAQRQYVLFTKGHEVKGLALNQPILQKDGFLKEGERVLDFFKRWAANGNTNIYVKK